MVVAAGLGVAHTGSGRGWPPQQAGVDTCMAPPYLPFAGILPHKLPGSRGDIFLGSYRMHVRCRRTGTASGQLAHLLQPQSHQPFCMTERRDKPFLTTPGSTDPENGAAGAAPRIQPAWVVKSEKVRVDLGLLKERLDKLKESVGVCVVVEGARDCCEEGLVGGSTAADWYKGPQVTHVCTCCLKKYILCCFPDMHGTTARCNVRRSPVCHHLCQLITFLLYIQSTSLPSHDSPSQHTEGYIGQGCQVSPWSCPGVQHSHQ